MLKNGGNCSVFWKNFFIFLFLILVILVYDLKTSRNECKDSNVCYEKHNTYSCPEHLHAVCAEQRHNRHEYTEQNQ